jgi:tetratricopeptide (TPR) repeat protein
VPTPAAGALTTAEIRAILEASAQSRRDPFEVLGLEPTDDDSQVRQAYARLARVLHPDAPLDPSLEDLRPLRQAAFVQLGQAVETVRSPGFRQYAAERAARLRARLAAAPSSEPAPAPAAAPAPTPTPAVSGLAPERQLQQAQAHFEAEQYWDAIQVLERLMVRAQGTTRARAGTLLAQAYLKNPKWRRRAEELLLDVVQGAPRYVPAHLLLADLYRAGGLTMRARGFYQKVVALQPDNEAAARALTALDPTPADPAPPSRIGGLFRRR